MSVDSKVTIASFVLRLTSARLTPFSPSRAFLTAIGHVPQVIPSTVRMTVEGAASAVTVTISTLTNTASIDVHRLIAYFPCCGRCETGRCS